MLFVPPQNFSAVLSQARQPEVLISPKLDLIAGIPDGLLALAAPVIAYWLYATFFHIVDVYELAEKYRIHPSEEEQARNKATLKDVLSDVALQHVIQTIVGYIFYCLDPVPITGHELYQMWYLRHHWVPWFVPDSLVWFSYTYGWSLLRLAVAVCIIDTWQYWLHRTMHVNKALYRRFHSRHHRLYVPYSYGALYNDPVEGFLLDTFGTGIAAVVTFLSPREAMFLYTFATMKTVDDHCGYRFPYDPFQMIFPNNALYHDIHHQNWGFRSNYLQPFFTFWDRLTNTQYQFVTEYKEKQKQITLEKYKEFLEKRKQRKQDMSRAGSQNSDNDVPETKKDI